MLAFSRGQFLESPDSQRARLAVSVYFKDRGFNSFASNMIKLSVNETKWSSLLAWTRGLILYISIWILDFGPEKSPGLSRNGPQVGERHAKLRARDLVLCQFRGLDYLGAWNRLKQCSHLQHSTGKHQANSHAQWIILDNNTCTCCLIN